MGLIFQSTIKWNNHILIINKMLSGFYRGITESFKHKPIQKHAPNKLPSFIDTYTSWVRKGVGKKYLTPLTYASPFFYNLFVRGKKE